MERMSSSSTSTSTLRDPGSRGGSFSFSCSDVSDLNFSSALSHLADEDGGDVVVGEDDDDGSDVEDDESYIEIALDRRPVVHEEDDDGGRLDHVDYLRISFSSSFPFPDFSTIPNPQDDTTVVFEMTTDDVQAAGAEKQLQGGASSSSTTSISASSTSVEDFNHDVTRTKRSKLPAVNRLVNTLFFRLWSSSSSDTTAKKVSSTSEHYAISHPQLHVDNDDFLQTRKVSNVKTTGNGGIMKLFFKFRAMNIGTLVASFVKPRKVVCPPDQDYCHFSKRVHKNKKPKAHQSTLENHKPLDKFFVRKKKKQQVKRVKMDSAREIGCSGGEKSRVLEKNLNAVRGVLEAIGSSMSTGASRKERRTRSCPSSIKSSPIHKEYGGDQGKVFAREISIQAAIAHCKFSFQQIS